ncbi:hypothetical protein [Streptomyces sp. NBC_01264]|uniref:hypothetical protein n=1 Tax=Streptomyces sp. NBC_01264 TaxID=2903804 RepID=UPI00224F5FE8|nr:hypothetical protein [Streptomyces sp. NBC_01264]MCX4776892.1 hypothetical protein [Streptomyces sp. NBC_01264]
MPIKTFRELTVEEYEQLCEDLDAPLRRLADLDDVFRQLCSEVRGLSYTVDTDAQRKITPLLLRAVALTADAVEVLGVLDSSKYASMPRRDSFLERVTGLVHDSSLATTNLAVALSANPYTETPAPLSRPNGYRPLIRHFEAEYTMAWHLAEGSNLLERSADTCTNAADAMSWDLDVADQARNQRHLNIAVHASAVTALPVAPPAKAAPPPSLRR